MMANQTSTSFIHEADVGVKCTGTGGFVANQVFISTRLWAAYLSMTRCNSRWGLNPRRPVRGRSGTRWRGLTAAVTFPVAISKAANSVVVPCRT
jgi:hypothetical protein